MLLWLLDHWWVANVVPYIAFNVWVLRTFEGEEGRFSRVARGFYLLLGLWIVLAAVAWMVLDGITGHVRYVSAMKKILTRGSLWRWIGRIALAVLSLAGIGLTLLAANVLVIAVVIDWQPDRRVLLWSNVMVIGFAVGFVALYYRYKREKFRGK